MVFSQTLPHNSFFHISTTTRYWHYSCNTVFFHQSDEHDNHNYQPEVTPHGGGERWQKLINNSLKNTLHICILNLYSFCTFPLFKHFKNPYKQDWGIYLFFSTKSNFIHLHLFLIYAVSEGKVYQKEKVSYTTF